MNEWVKTIRMVCPGCATDYVAADATAVGYCVCCGAAIAPPRTDATTRLSRKAIASAILGASSLALMFLTALPAIVLGVWALADLQRSPEKLRGHAWAIAGILSGFFFGLLCGPGVAATILQVVQQAARQAAP